MSPRITVAIPAYNRPALLAEALSSVAAQTFGDFEVLISDNASTEEIASTISAFKDKRFKVVRQPTNLGAAGNWRYVLETPTTELVAWLHADDLWAPDHLQRAVEGFQRYPEAGLHSSAVRFFTGNEEREIQRLRGHEEATDQIFFTSSEALAHWMYRLISQCSAHVFRREVLKGLDWGPKNLFYRLDQFLVGQILCRGGWIYDPRVTAQFRIEAGSMASTSGEFGKQAAQGAWVLREVSRRAFEAGHLDADRICRIVSSWDVARRGGLLTSYFCPEAPKPLRQCARKVLQAYPDTLTAADASRSCHLAHRFGPWFLSVAEYVNRARCKWWPSYSRRSEA